MIVISDTSPLNYLVLIEMDYLLPALFGRIVIPAAVHAELRSDRAPEKLQRWLAEPHPWLEVQATPPIDPELMKLDAGEGEVT